MSKKCEKCGAPIEGFWAKISKIFGVKKSEKNPNLCNKCDTEEEQTSPEQKPAAESLAMEMPKEEIMPKPEDDLMKKAEIPVVEFEKEKPAQTAQPEAPSESVAPASVETKTPEEEKPSVWPPKPEGQ